MQDGNGRASEGVRLFNGDLVVGNEEPFNADFNCVNKND